MYFSLYLVYNDSIKYTKSVVSMATFQERFNNLFDESDLSQEQFGAKFNASKFQVFNWRNGRGEPDIETLKKIAKVCDVSVEWLTGNSNVRRLKEIIADRDPDGPQDDLPAEARKSIDEFKAYIRSKYERKPTTK